MQADDSGDVGARRVPGQVGQAAAHMGAPEPVDPVDESLAVGAGSDESPGGAASRLVFQRPHPAVRAQGQEDPVIEEKREQHDHGEDHEEA